MLALDDTPPGSSHRPQSVGAAGHHSGGSSHRDRDRDREPHTSSRERKRASHAPTSSSAARENDENLAPIRDVYSHPAALAYAAAHPRRNIPRFGPYLLLQTIGEGEFGKVKLGLHSQWGEEVAVKLIRRGSVDNTVRMSKVEREIDVLKTIRHPNIVRLYDVIETDKYIGIVLEYASGGELFDHILAHRCLKEKDACRLFAQVISGVSYIHAKKIVHRDLKLENLLLDRNRNVIISDFGFANRFEHRADDLMQTSCGSPCYAAPELVISEGMYVGSAVDIWSCGVILYAMLAGYLPFDDDPANPDGDNINLLYKYIINTPLTFPDYISEDARDLLSKMLVPDPTRRADLQTIMNHHWLRTYKQYFERSVEECEEAAFQQYEQKRLEYSRKLRARQPEEEHRPRRHERATLAADTSAPPSAFAASAAVLSDSALASYGNHSMDAESTHTSSRRAQAVSAIVMPTQRRGSDRYQDPSMSLDQDSVIIDQRAVVQPVPAEEPAPKEKKSRKKAADRHTIQVEYDDPEAVRAASRPPMPAPSSVADVFSAASEQPVVSSGRRASQPIVDTSTQQRSRMGSTPPVALSHAFAPPQVDEPRTQPVSVTVTPSAEPKRSASVRTSNSKSRSRVSLTALGKMLSPGSPSVPVPDSPAHSVESAQTQTPKPEQVSRATSLSVSQHSSARQTEDESTQDHSGADAGDSSFAKMRRRTLNLVVGGTRTDKKSRQSKQVEKAPATAVEASSSTLANGTFAGPPVGIPDPIGASGASTSKAKRVMDWFRSRSINRGRPDADVPVDIHTLKTPVGVPSTISSGRHAPQLIVTTPHDASHDPLLTPITPSVPSGGLSRVANSLVNTILPPRSVSSPAVSSHAAASVMSVYALRIHHGAVDQGTVTTGSPPDVFAHVTSVLLSMGVEFHKETEFKYRCVRPKRRKVSAQPPPSPHKDVAGPQGVAAYTMVGSASLNGVDKRGLPQPPTISSTAGMLRGLLTRRASSHVSEPDEDGVRSTTSASRSVMGPQPLPTAGGANQDPLYGDRSQDLCDEVRFSVELTRIDRLDDTLSLDIRRLKGNLRSYKFLYDTLRDRCHFAA